MTGRGAAGPAEEHTDAAVGPVAARSRGLVTAGVAVAASAVLVLHALGAGALDPVALTVSDYIAVPAGPALLGVAAAGLAVAGAALACAAPRSGWPRAVPLLLAAWCAALLLVALFPTHPVGAPPDTAAVVHRWAGAFVFALPPVAGLLAARSDPGPLRAWSVAAGVAACAFLLAHAPAVLAGAPPLPVLGLVERVAYLAVLGQVLAFGRAAVAPRAAGADLPAVGG